MADAGRVIAGRAKGIRLRGPGRGTRPLGDRVKQSVFGALDPMLPGARVLDLFAGSGAAGIEALSRGAARCVFVERDAAAARAIADNLERAGLSATGARVVRADALAWLADRDETEAPFDLAIVDPPYDQAADLEAALGRLGAESNAGRLLADRAVVVAKHFWRTPPPAVVGLLASDRVRRFGETAITFYRRGATGGEAG